MSELLLARRIDGIVSLGGSGGTSLATTAMRSLPLGLPKVMVSTLASGNVAQYVDVSDIVMMPAIVDASGLNRISQAVFARAAAAVVAMAETNVHFQPNLARPLVVASAFGNTTRCVEQGAQRSSRGGIRGNCLSCDRRRRSRDEALIESGMVAGVLDVTTTEWADQLAGGVMPAERNACWPAPREVCRR